MTQTVHMVILGVLVTVHLFLIVWAVGGLVEFFAPSVPWTRFSNPLFPGWVLLAQWLLILPTAIVFIGGLALGWQYTPVAVTVGYVAMAALCAYQTFAIMTNDSRFVAMAAEYVAYVVIALYLFRSDYVGGLLGRAG